LAFWNEHIHWVIGNRSWKHRRADARNVVQGGVPDHREGRPDARPRRGGQWPWTRTVAARQGVMYDITQKEPKSDAGRREPYRMIVERVPTVAYS
jgi:hypothetical protein